MKKRSIFRKTKALISAKLWNFIALDNCHSPQVVSNMARISIWGLKLRFFYEGHKYLIKYPVAFKISKFVIVNSYFLQNISKFAVKKYFPLFLKQCLHDIYLTQFGGTFTKSVKLTSLKVPPNWVNWRLCKYCLKNEWTLLWVMYSP